jgi:hypothetical protein
MAEQVDGRSTRVLRDEMKVDERRESSPRHVTRVSRSRRGGGSTFVTQRPALYPLLNELTKNSTLGFGNEEMHGEDLPRRPCTVK